MTIEQQIEEMKKELKETPFERLEMFIELQMRKADRNALEKAIKDYEKHFDIVNKEIEQCFCK